MNTALNALSAHDHERLKWAYHQLEHPSFAARLSNALGAPIDQALQLLPKQWYQRLHDATERSIRKTLDLAIGSMEEIPPGTADEDWHKIAVMGSGALGGFFGPLTLFLELPVTTALMLRSIADIAHSEGEDLSTTEARLACMEVFALGGRSGQDEATETGYYGLRITLSFHFSSALLHTPSAKVSNIPAGIELVRAIASRFGIAVSDKFAAQIIPIAGALSGAMLNVIFMQHFQTIARGHFIVRSLERKYGSELVRSTYERFVNAEQQRPRSYSPVEGW